MFVHDNVPNEYVAVNVSVTSRVIVPKVIEPVALFTSESDIDVVRVRVSETLRVSEDCSVRVDVRESSFVTVPVSVKSSVSVTLRLLVKGSVSVRLTDGVGGGVSVSVGESDAEKDSVFSSEILVVRVIVISSETVEDAVATRERLSDWERSSDGETVSVASIVWEAE